MTNDKIIVQSFWTKPIAKERLGDAMYMAALSMTFARRSGYKVHMHTDSFGMSLLHSFGYDNIYPTLDAIPDKTPRELFAAGKFFALRAEGIVGKVHADFDVFIKKPCLDRFFLDKRIDVICQQEEDVAIYCDHDDKIRAMHVLGYPPATRPDWLGSMNTGIVGFNNAALAEKYMNNYFEALDMYTQDIFDQYRQTHEAPCLLFDFILEQVVLSYMSVGYNVLTLLPMHGKNLITKEIGYAHYSGPQKWSDHCMSAIKRKLHELDPLLYEIAGGSSPC